MNLEEFLLRGGYSLLLAVLATAIAAALAVACGALDAWNRLGGRAPSGAAVYAPPLFALLPLVLIEDAWPVLLAGVIAWLNLAWVVQRQVGVLRGRAFVDAARMAGLAPGRIVGRHVLPHLTTPVGLRSLLTLPQVLAGDVLRQLLEAAMR